MKDWDPKTKVTVAVAVGCVGLAIVVGLAGFSALAYVIADMLIGG